MSSNKNLTDLRDDINNVDSKILNLLSERRKLSEEIINTKIESDQPIRDTQRETELLSRIITEGKELGLDSHYISKIFYDIIDDSVRMQQNHFRSALIDADSDVIRVAIQGIEGSYSSMAARKFFSQFKKDIIFISLCQKGRHIMY